jgi:hypothetical protein
VLISIRAISTVGQRMKIVLVYPPTCDPTAPYLSLPLLAACLRAAGHEVLLLDANLEAYDRLLRPEALAALAARLERRLARLEERATLDHEQQLAYTALWGARGDAAFAPGAIAEALATMRDRTGERFYDPARYGAAVAAIESALRLVSAAYHPLELSFASYRTPFSLLDLRAIEADARPERSPFAAPFGELAERLRDASPDLIGISAVFPGQLQPAYALAAALRAALPETPIVGGGPALTQLLCRLEGPSRERALGPFHAAVLFEGEDALLELLDRLARGEPPRGCLEGTRDRSLADLPAPDYAGMPLDRYLAPEPVLSYDLSRGCYWGRCAFCHYGLAERGCARYRERPVAFASAHLAELAHRHGARLLYLSQDSVAPRTILGLARALRGAGGGLRWSTDLRPEPFFDAARSRELAAGGALSVSVGVEAAAPRVLELIDKGITVEEMASAIQSLAAAGIATELMCFTDFPTETRAEALATLRFLEEHRREVSLFMCGEFALTAGSRVAAEPRAFGLDEVFRVAGDELGTGLFYTEQRTSKSPEARDAVEASLARIARGYQTRSYPWAGSLSTAHTMLWYDRHGPGIFRELAGKERRRSAWGSARASFDVTEVAARCAEREAEIWEALVYERRQVSARAYRALARDLPAARRRAGRFRFAPGRAPERERRR